ncbi:MAG: primosomal protein N' [Bacteroidota bacterium]|nr:primosomal protein N' [Bacteroidota bacterium]
MLTASNNPFVKKTNLLDEDLPEVLLAEIILPLNIDKTYSYRVPNHLMDDALPGKRVIIQFGKKKIYTGIILQLHNKLPGNYQAKYLLEIIDDQPIINEKQLKFWSWISAYYCCSIGQVMDAALPAYLKLKSESHLTLNTSFDLANVILDDREKTIIDLLKLQVSLDLHSITQLSGIKSVMPIIKSLYEKHIIQLIEEVEEKFKPKFKPFVSLNPEYNHNKAFNTLFEQLERSPKQSDILLAWVQHSRASLQTDISRQELMKMAGASASALDALIKKGIFLQADKEIDRIIIEEPEQFDNIALSELQLQCVYDINQEFNTHPVVLLNGVTGSGKTFVYIQLIRNIISTAGQVLYMVPESALGAQLIAILIQTFGNQVSIFDEKYNQNEKIEFWHKIWTGQHKIIVAKRNGIFLPFHQLNLIIIDEEHDQNYKQSEPAPRYHGRDAAIYLADIYKAKVLLASATPSFDSYYNTNLSKYGYVELNATYHEVTAPSIELIDMKNAVKKKQVTGSFSSELTDKIQLNIVAKKQTIVFQNRRGYSPLLECTSCGWTPECVNCAISLTYYQRQSILACHYCGYKSEIVKLCANCGNNSLKTMGSGTERVEEEVVHTFAGVRVMRIDQETTRRKNSFHQMLMTIKAGEVDVIVGTQMLSKGLDFENVELICILNGDLILRTADYKAAERTYQLIIQLAGRSGRRTTRGRIWIQTYRIDDPIFNYIKARDFKKFYEFYIDERRQLDYPPFYRLIKLTVKHEKQELSEAAAKELDTLLRKHLSYEILGPTENPIPRIRNKFLYNFLIKIPKNKKGTQIDKLNIIQMTNSIKALKIFKTIQIAIDVDPI